MNYPTVMIGTMVKNSGQWLEKYFGNILNWTYPKEKLRFVFVYGKSTDNSLEILKKYKNIINMEVYLEPNDSALRIGGAQMAASIYNDWKELLEEDYFLLLDSDVIFTPNNLIEELMKVKADIIAPYPYCYGKEYFYDSWIFRIDNKRFSPHDPPGKGLNIPIKVDSVGTCFLTHKECFLRVPITNPYPNLSFCNNARKMGYTVVACPYIKIYHEDVLELGHVHNPLPPEYGGYPAPGWVDSKYPVETLGSIKVEAMEV